MRSFKGQVPSAHEGWEFRHRLTAEDGDWAIYQQSQAHSQDWVTIKVVALQRVPGKANYWCAYNKQARRIGFARDLMVMREYRPDLFDKVDTLMKMD